MSQNREFRFPAEFEPHVAIWIAWPVFEYKRGLSAIPMYIEIIRALTPHVKVKIQVNDAASRINVERLLISASIDMNQVTLHDVPHDDIWLRDPGPIFVSDGFGRKKIVLMDFDCYGYEAADSPHSMLAKRANELIATEMQLDTISSELIGEGGAREFNGKGSMIAVKSVECQRNPTWSIEEMENEFHRLFQVNNIIWLEEGIAEDDSTWTGPLEGPDGNHDIWTPNTTAGGHVDEVARFSSPSTVLLAEVTEEEALKDPIARENRRRLERNFQILHAAKDQDGNPFRIVRIPHTDHLYANMTRGDGGYDALDVKYEFGCPFPMTDEIKVIAVTSYLNFLVTNGIVILPRYWQPGLPVTTRHKDQTVLEIFKAEFPDREIVQIACIPINFGGGGIHCMTQQEPI